MIEKSKINDLINLQHDDEISPPKKAPTVAKLSEPWYPDLNPTQRRIFDDPANFILGHAEKGSGKSIGFLHKGVRHCYENRDALFILITPSILTGKEGIMYDLEELVLPAWRDGNKVMSHSEWNGEYLDHGIGLEFTESRLDPNTKHKYLWIGNIHGGWSKVIMISIPYAAAVEKRVKGPAPSMVYIDEITEFDGPEIMEFTAAQLGRRRSIQGPQQFTASCNPKGPGHWVYQKFFIDPVLNKETGEMDPEFSVYHVPVLENKHRLPKGYVENLVRIWRNNEIERKRNVEGIWIDKPDGSNIFSDTFVPDIHIKGDFAKAVGLQPIVGYPITVGYDPGPANFSITLEQMIPTEERNIWIIFDELNYVGKRAKYTKVIRDLQISMSRWCEIMESDFRFEHISDEAAFNQVKSDGSYEFQEIQSIASARVKAGLSKFNIRMKPCPKGKESVKARVRMFQDMLGDESIFVSATCRKHIDMFNHLKSKLAKKDEYDPDLAFKPVRSIFLHPFDSASYPPFYYQTKGFVPKNPSTGDLTGVFTAGQSKV